MNNTEDILKKYQAEFHEIEQVLGKALGYSWLKDDQTNFHESTESDGVCVGEHVAATLAMEAAEKIGELEKDKYLMLETIAACLQAAGGSDDIRSTFATLREELEKLKKCQQRI